MKKIFFCMFTLFFISSAFSEEILRIQIGRNDDSDAQLRERIAHLERAVSQLQMKVYNLSVNQVEENRWTCRITVFSRFYTATGTSKSDATNNTLAMCAKKENAMFCNSNSVECGAR